jgi:hypothetical protein
VLICTKSYLGDYQESRVGKKYPRPPIIWPGAHTICGMDPLLASNGSVIETFFALVPLNHRNRHTYVSCMRVSSCCLFVVVANVFSLFLNIRYIRFVK